MLGDVLSLLAVMALVGLAAQPIARAVLAPLPGAGAGLARPLGLLLAAVPLWLGASVGLFDYTTTSAWLSVAALVVAGAITARRKRAERTDRSLLIGAEVVFATCLLAGTAVVAHAPDVTGTEKPMDMALLSAATNAREFPPVDPWLSGHDLDTYYYLGHYLVGYVMRLAGTGPTEGYNLGIALVWALAASAAFGLGGAASAALRSDGRGALLGGSLAALLTVVGSNLEGLRLLLAHGWPLDEWFNAARVVPGAVNDFPAFELVLGDLHAHVIAVPFILLALAFALHAVVDGPRPGARVAVAGLAAGALIAINSWSYPVVLGLVLAAGALGVRSRGRLARWAAALVAVSLLAYLPFLLDLETGASEGVVRNPDRRGLADFAGDLLRVQGIALVAVLAATVAAVPGHARRALLAIAIPVTVLGALAGDLGGPALLAAGLAAAVLAALNAHRARRFVFLLVAGGLVCVLVPELVYVRDAFDGTPAYRLNTVFKVGFHAWLLFGIAAGIVLADAFTRLGHAGRRRAGPALGLLAVTAVAFPLAAIDVRTDGFAGPATLDGLGWLDRMAPGDRSAIAWLRGHTPHDAVVLEAAGREYSSQGHGRISSFTGRPTIVQWPEHLLFRVPAEQLGKRVDDVREIYETPDDARAASLLGGYGVSHVVVGPTERVSYTGSGLAKFARIGRVVFERDGTTIYEVGRT